jgi:ribosome-binding factor A
MAKHNDTGPEGRSVRLLRVGEQFRHILSELLARGEVHDDILNSHSVSVTEVRMSPDLRHATAFIKPLLGVNEAVVLKALRTISSAHKLRTERAKRADTETPRQLEVLILQRVNTQDRKREP